MSPKRRGYKSWNCSAWEEKAQVIFSISVGIWKDGAKKEELGFFNGDHYPSGSGWPFLHQGLGPEDLWRSLLTLTALWVCGAGQEPPELGLHKRGLSKHRDMKPTARQAFHHRACLCSLGSSQYQGWAAVHTCLSPWQALLPLSRPKHWC